MVDNSKKTSDEIQTELNEVNDKLKDFSKLNEEAVSSCAVLKKFVHRHNLSFF